MNITIVPARDRKDDVHFGACRGSTLTLAEAEIVIDTKGRVIKDRYGTTQVWTNQDGVMKIIVPAVNA